MSPELSTLLLARDNPDQAKVLPVAIKCPPALTWRAELPQLPVWENVAPWTFRVPATESPNVVLPVSVAARTAPVPTFTFAPADTASVLPCLIVNIPEMAP